MMSAGCSGLEVGQTKMSPCSCMLGSLMVHGWTRGCLCAYEGGNRWYVRGLCDAGHWTQHGRQVDVDASSRLHHHSRTTCKWYRVYRKCSYMIAQKTLGRCRLSVRKRCCFTHDRCSAKCGLVFMVILLTSKSVIMFITKRPVAP